MKNITTEQIEGIKKLLLNRNKYKDIKEILEDLEDSKEDLIIKDLKDLIRNRRVTILEADIWDIINKYIEEK